MNADETAHISDESPAQIETTETSADVPDAPSLRKKKTPSNRILLVPYPKYVFMYPTLIMSAICTLIMYLGGYTGVLDPEQDSLPVILTAMFLIVLMANSFILVFDFPRATSLTLVFIITTIAFGFWILSLARPDILPAISHAITSVRPLANAAFFLCWTIGMVIMFIAVKISVKFNYWELRNNELLHHHGFLSDLKRYPAPNLRVDKEINDVFEYMLLGAGRLILHPSTEKRAIVLDNVLWVSDKERELTRMLGSIKVKIGQDSNA